jgi:hypothetical protein
MLYHIVHDHLITDRVNGNALEMTEEPIQEPNSRYSHVNLTASEAREVLLAFVAQAAREVAGIII